MDALADVLDGVRARSAAFCRAVLTPPWALRIADGAVLALATVLRGQAWIVPDDAEPVLVRTGEVAVVKGPAPYTVSDQPTTQPTVIVHAGNRLTTLDGVDVTVDRMFGARGRDERDATIVASGAYPVTGDIGARLLAALPSLLLVPHKTAGSPVLDLLAAEIDRDAPGQQVVLDRLLDLALIATLRAWFARPEAKAPGWYRALSDPLVGPALRLVHDDPARGWTIADLAQKAGASRAAFARRFASLVGEPPMSYLTNWRISVAADLLRHTDDTIEAIARRVGYANAFAFSVAFKRLRGATPRQYRLSPPPPTQLLGSDTARFAHGRPDPALAP